MKWTVPFPLFPAEHLVPMAKAAEAAGFDTIAMPDSVFFPEQVSAEYPYSADGGRFWEPDTPFVDPFVGISAMIGVTERIRFVTNVVKLPIRDPLLVAKQLSVDGQPVGQPHVDRRRPQLDSRGVRRGPTPRCAPGAGGPTR